MQTKQRRRNMKKLIVLVLLISSFSFGQQYRKSAMESWYKDVVKARVSSIVHDSLGTAGNILSRGNFNMFGATTLGLGDSVTVSAGAKIADTSAFTTTATIKAIYIAGATAADTYVLTLRRIQEVSTVAMTDSTKLSYMAKTDSLIVYRPNGNVSGTKFSWFRIKLQ
jgi:hypothetical protein